MTRKDYITIADGIVDGVLEFKRKNEADEIIMDAIFRIVSSLENELYKDNNKFDFNRFRDYIEERICD